MSALQYEVVIGLEVHCQLRTSSKMFSPCPFTFGSSPNTLTDPYTLALPGTLPVPNRRAIDFAVALALATNSTIHASSRFARKHYFYPDLPKGYQITQSDHPYATGGFVEIPTEDGASRRVRLTRIHLEEDAGKNIHVQGQPESWVDFNRAGAPLLEVVSEPDLRSAAEAADYLRELRAIVRSLGISDANMEEGTLRCDANVSLRPRGSKELGTRCEIKNLNSFRYLEQAILSEVRRQRELLECGEPVRQATLSFDPAADRTRIMRMKEHAADYRYFPEPDLPPLEIPSAWVERVRATLPELPAARRTRLLALGLAPADVELLTREPDLGDFFDAMLRHGISAVKACNWLTVELLGRLHREGRSIGDSPVQPAALAELVALVDEGTISGRTAKDVFARVYDVGESPRAIVEREGHRQVQDESVILTWVREVVADAPTQLAQYRSGKTTLRGWFVGQVMKLSRGQANPELVQRALDAVLDEELP